MLAAIVRVVQLLEGQSEADGWIHHGSLVGAFCRVSHVHAGAGCPDSVDDTMA